MSFSSTLYLIFRSKSISERVKRNIYINFFFEGVLAKMCHNSIDQLLKRIMGSFPLNRWHSHNLSSRAINVIFVRIILICLLIKLKVIPCSFRSYLFETFGEKFHVYLQKLHKFFHKTVFENCICFLLFCRSEQNKITIIKKGVKLTINN